jgi:hypothetical protein
VVALARRVKPWRAGGAVALLCLLMLAFAGAGSGPFWNGALAGAVLATGAVFALERRKVRS